jgi:molybdopterin-dependent oxidoreductase alpha subunit
MSDKTPSARKPEGIRPYDAPAGGWGSLRSVAKTLKKEQRVADAAATLLKTNQPDGFDCPGCAWPDPKHTSSFEFCENGAKAVVWEATAKRVTPAFFAQHTVAELWTQSDHWLEAQGRVTDPMRYDHASDTYVPVAWDEAFAAIGAGLTALPDPNLAEFYASGRTSNEAAFLYQLFVRMYGTNNFPDCSNLCHEPTSVGLPQSIGAGKGTVSLEDFEHTDLIISIGHNPGTNHPRMLGTLRDAVKRGATILVFNPMRERGLETFQSPKHISEMATGQSTDLAQTFYQVKIGGDAAAIKGIIKALGVMDAQTNDVLDHGFIAEHTQGLDGLLADASATDWADIEAASGLSQAQLEEVAGLYAKARATIICYGMGVTQHRSGVKNVQQIANLLLLRGNMGKPGAGICPLRGHSNVQGDRTVGINERPPEALLDALERVFGFTPPREHGHSVVDSMEAMADGRAKAAICLGGNLAIASPSPQDCIAGFQKLDLAVHITTKLNRSHLIVGRGRTTAESYILPCIGRTEKDIQASGEQSVTVEDSMSMVHASKGFLDPASPNIRSEPAIIAGIAKATVGNTDTVDWDALVGDYALIRDQIEAVFPDFYDFNTRVQAPGGFHLPNPAASREWNTSTGKAQFIVFPGLHEDPQFSDPDVLKLTTVRSHDQYNTTIYGLDDRYRGVFGRRDVLFMNARDIKRLGFVEGDRVDLVGAQNAARAVYALTIVAYDLPKGCCASYYPETQALIGLDDRDEAARTPSFKAIPIRLRPATNGQNEGFAITREGLVGL